MDIFGISTFKSGPSLGCFDTFWLPNMLGTTPACNFSSIILPCGSAASLLFDPLEPKIIGKQSVSRLSYLLAHLHLLSSDFLFSDLLSSPLLFSDIVFWLSSLTLPISAFHLSILSEVWLKMSFNYITSSNLLPFIAKNSTMINNQLLLVTINLTKTIMCHQGSIIKHQTQWLVTILHTNRHRHMYHKN